jgi:hypothetical protein
MGGNRNEHYMPILCTLLKEHISVLLQEIKINSGFYCAGINKLHTSGKLEYINQAHYKYLFKTYLYFLLLADSNCMLPTAFKYIM